MRNLVTIAASAALTVASTSDAQRITRRESHGEVVNRVTVNTIVTAIDNSSRVVPRLSALTTIPVERIRVVDVRTSIPAARRSTYTAALERNEKSLAELRVELVMIDPVVKVLGARRPALTVDDVVGAGILDVIETGKSANVLVLYVDNRNRINRSTNGNGATATSYRPGPATLFAALQSTPETVAFVSALEGLRLDRIRLYDIDKMLGDADAERYRMALRTNETSIRALRAELSKWPVVLRALEQHEAKLLLGDIFAADVVNDGSVLVLYYRRKA
ncbi:MAG TPA: hypothetical protein VJ717_08595 [Gemmatimonadaceae bacterium]|nr:hypothetical protein [Gemmatimonadaceae bacterium]